MQSIVLNHGSGCFTSRSSGVIIKNHHTAVAVFQPPMKLPSNLIFGSANACKCFLNRCEHFRLRLASMHFLLRLNTHEECSMLGTTTPFTNSTSENYSISSNSSFDQRASKRRKTASDTRINATTQPVLIQNLSSAPSRPKKIISAQIHLGPNFTEKDLADIRLPKELTGLNLTPCLTKSVSEACILNYIKSFPELNDLCIEYLSDSSMEELTKSKSHLTSLTIGRVPLDQPVPPVVPVQSEASVRFIAYHLPSLKSLSLTNCVVNEIETLRALCLLKNLTDLSLSSDKFGDEAACHLVSELPHLRGLSLRKWIHLTDQGLLNIAKINSKLTFLDLSLCPQITLDGLIAAVEALPNLKHLKVSDLWHKDNQGREPVQELLYARPGLTFRRY